MKIVETMHQVSRTVGKHSPLILTATGVIGLGATAYTTYKSAGKVEKIVEDIEYRRSVEERLLALENKEETLTTQEISEIQDIRTDLVPVDRFTVVKELAGALALPVLLGAASITCIGLSYHIQNKRILGLAGALATASAEREYYRRRFVKEYGEDEYKRFSTPTKVEKGVVTDENGKEKEVEKTIKEEADLLHGQWFDKSEHYANDDHSYNMQFVRSVEDQINMALFRKGFVLMNEVNDKLGFERTRMGALLGWSTSTGFELVPEVTNITQEDGEIRPEIFVKWKTPKYIYDQIELPDENKGYATI